MHDKFILFNYVGIILLIPLDFTTEFRYYKYESKETGNSHIVKSSVA